MRGNRISLLISTAVKCINIVPLKNVFSMKYNLEDIKLRKVADGKPNAGSLFIQATVVNPDDEYEEPGTMTTFNERLVKKFSELLVPSVAGGTDQFGRQIWNPSQLKDANKPIPENLLVFTGGQFEQVPTPGGVPYVRLKDGSDEPATNPKNGQYYIVNSIMVLTKKTVDNETGERRYAKGWSPQEQASGIWNNLYAPLSKFDGGSAGVVLPGDPASQIAPPAGAAPAV